jgi:ABC-2 type transport system permease protein
VWLGQVGILIRKELLQIVRDRALLLFTVYIFTLDILLAAGNAGFDVRQAPIGIVDHDRSTASRAHVSVPPAALRLALAAGFARCCRTDARRR